MGNRLVRYRAELNARKTIGGLQEIPHSVAIDGDVGFAVAVVVRRDRFIGCRAELRAEKSITTAEQIPDSVSENSDVGLAVAVVIRRDWSVAALPKRDAVKLSRRTVQPIPISRRRSKDRDV